MSDLRTRLQRVRHAVDALQEELSAIWIEIEHLEQRLQAAEARAEASMSQELWETRLEACSVFQEIERYEVRNLVAAVWEQRFSCGDVSGTGVNQSLGRFRRDAYTPVKLKAYLREQFGLQRNLATKADLVVAYAFLVHGKAAYLDLESPQALLEEIGNAITAERHQQRWHNFAKPRPVSSHQEALETLGLDAGASWENIKLAYRMLAKRYHPDTGGDQVQFRQIQKAYEQLINRRQTH